MSRDPLDIVKKVWGQERIIINCSIYCGKLLILKEGGLSSCHYHKKKQETFYVLSGEINLSVDNIVYTLTHLSLPVTIFPKQKHYFYGVSSATIIEISTPHDDEDVYRITESRTIP